MFSMKSTIIFISIIVSVILISGCVQQGKLEPAMAMSPYIEFEATVISI